MEYALENEEFAEVFGDFDPRQHDEEAEQRWGGTDPYRESARRAASYRKDDWRRIQAEAAEIEARLAAALQAGAPADGPEAMDAAEAHRQHISRWFYDCSLEIHTGLAAMYVQDPRFTAHYDDRAEGLARFVHDAIVANAARRS